MSMALKAGRPVLCVQLPSSPARKPAQTAAAADLGPGPSSTQQKTLTRDEQGSTKENRPKASVPPTIVAKPAAQSAYWDPAHTPRTITATHMELLDMTAGESRTATVERVLRSRERLLASLAKDDPCAGAFRSVSPSKRPSSCKSSQAPAGMISAAEPDTPRLLKDLEEEHPQQAMERLLSSRPFVLASRNSDNSPAATKEKEEKGTKNEKEDGDGAPERSQVWQSVRTTKSFVQKWSSSASANANLESKHVYRSEMDGGETPELNESWMSSLSRTIGMEVSGQISALAEGFKRPEGVVSRVGKGRSLRSSKSWRG